MKKYFAIFSVLTLLVALSATQALAQASGTVKGTCKDTEGKPITGAVVEWRNLDNGRKYSLKTNGKGEYFSLGIDAGKYDVTLSKDGKQLDKVSNFPVSLDEATPDL